MDNTKELLFFNFNFFCLYNEIYGSDRPCSNYLLSYNNQGVSESIFVCDNTQKPNSVMLRLNIQYAFLASFPHEAQRCQTQR